MYKRRHVQIFSYSYYFSNIQKTNHKNMNFHLLYYLLLRDVDKIDDLMQDITEQQDVAREISEAISGPFGEQFDEVSSVFHFIFYLYRWVFFCLIYFYSWSTCVYILGIYTSLK